jgi:hypothetical protein
LFADAVVINSYEETIGIYLGDGKGRLNLLATYPATDPGAISIADLNDDGNPDLIIGNPFDNTLTLFFGASDGTFGSPVALPVNRPLNAIAADDFNHDGKVDLVAAFGVTPGTFEFMAGKGDGTFRKALLFSVGARPVSIAVGDFDQDGALTPRPRMTMTHGECTSG